VKDLRVMAATKDRSPGHSYEPWGFMGGDNSVTTTMRAWNGRTWKAPTILKTLIPTRPILFEDGHTEFVKVGHYIRGRGFSQDWNHVQ
jgi:hypothetical protein